MTKLLVDASNAWYRSYLATVLDPPGGPVMIMTYMLRKLCQKHGRDNVVICWDGGSTERKKLDPNYKGQRTSRPNVWEDILYMYRMVECLGIPFCRVNEHEADDVIGSIAKNSADDILIHSYDKDFYQLVSNKVRILRPERKIGGKAFPEQIITEAEVREEFGCSPEKVVLVKAFQGDTSDNIAKIGIRFTKNFLAEFYAVIEKSNSVEEFYSHISDFDEKYQNQIIEFKDRALLNEKLVQINTGLEAIPHQSKQDLSVFALLCAELEITRLKASDWEEMPTTTAELPPMQNSLF